MKYFLPFVSCFLLLATSVLAQSALSTITAKKAQDMQTQLKSLTNFQVDTPNMVSAGLPSKAHFLTMQRLGVSHVIDLIPGDRSDEAALLASINMPYSNVAVEWNAPSLQNFIDYVAYMKAAEESTGVVLTHCKLNWRGAVFTYLYRVTQLQHDDASAKQHMHETWEPNRTWQGFITEVKAHYATR